MKKLFLLLSFGLCSLASWAQDENYDFYDNSTGQTLYYRIAPENTVEVTYPGMWDWEGFDAPTGELTIPSTVRYNNIDYSVTTILPRAFYGCNGLTSVTIPNSVTSIGNSAFSGCGGLTSVTIPNSVTTIESGAFSGCSGLTSVTIPSSVTTIRDDTFFYCSGLTSVTIPNSVTRIGKHAFENCSGLTYVVIGSSVDGIGNNAFYNCINLRTVYMLSSSQNISNTITGFKDEYMGGTGNVRRVIISSYIESTNVSGDNAINCIQDYYTIVDGEISNASRIPYSQLPANFIGMLNGSSDWVAREIVLTDDTSRFCSPEAFTADSVSYTREFADGHRSTLYLPFTAAIPEDLEVYEFSDFDGSTLHFSPSTDSIRAYTPYLVGYGLEKSSTKCVISQKNAKFPATADATPAYTTTHGGMTFKGTLARTGDLSTNNYGYKDGFFVQSGGAAHVNPFRCYFSYSGDTPSQMPPHTLSVAFGDGPLAIDAAEAPATNGSIRYSNDVYDLMGRLVRKDAATLDGLPTGIYIWKGRKVLAK